MFAVPPGRFLFLLSIIVVGAVRADAQAGASKGSAGRAHLTPDQMRADVAAFRTEFLARDRSYSAADRARAEAALQRLESQLASVSPATFELTLDRIVAMADNGHTSAFPGARASHYNHVPIRMLPFGDEFRVVRAANSVADLLGASLVAIDGHPLTLLRDSARSLVGGVAAWRDRGVSHFLESPEQLFALGLSLDPEHATYSFHMRDGRVIQRVLTGELLGAEAGRFNTNRWLFPEPLPSEGGGWRTLLSTKNVPWSLQNPDAAFRWRDAPEIDAMVIELRQIHDAPGQPIADFLTEMTQRIRAARPRHLVIDLRMNGGGDLNTARDFMKSVPSLVPGRIFALTSPWTFSAAISSLGYLEQAAPDRVTIVGEEVGDRLVFFAEGRPIVLPNSRAVVLYATERHDYKGGCRDYTDCHPPVVRNPIAVPTLAPDIAAPWTFEAYRAGRDPAMDAVKAALRR